MLSSRVVFHFAFLCTVHHSHEIEALSQYIEPMDILNEAVNQIFSSLQLQTHRGSKVREYSKMHKYFVRLARLYKNDWIELLKITSLDINFDNGTGDYTTTINEVLNEDNKTEAVNDMLNEDNVNKHIENFLGTLESVKELYLRNDSFITVNYEILHRFYRNRHSLGNKTVDRLQLAQNDSDFWVPDGRRIYRGKRTKIKNFPFVASVHMFDQFTCAGSIIHADLVITAASCLQLAHNNRFYRENPSYLSVRIGSSTYAGGDQVPVLEVYFYPSYEPKTLKNNLAILRLQRLIKFQKKNKNVKKIRVDTNAWALPRNTDGITIIGWGARKASNKIYNPWKNKLAMDVLHFYGLADCRDVYSKTLVTKKNFCAGFISHGGGACNRDVGAPGVVNGILAGVVSFGSANCGERDSPTVFTKLGYYIDWIEDIMAQDPPKQSVRVTTRRPHLFPTIMSTPPLHESNFLIEPIDLSKVPDLRDLDVRMPQKDNNEFINIEFNSMQSVSRQTFSTGKQITQPNPEDHKKFVDNTRLRDQNENKGSPETTYEPPQLYSVYTVIGNSDEDKIFPASNYRFAKTSTIADLLVRTRAQNNELKDAKSLWQIDLDNAEKSESVEDTTEIRDDTRESVTTNNFELNTTPLNVKDKSFEADHTFVEKLLPSDDYDDDNETVIMQQSLPIHPISKEKVPPIKTPEKAILNEKISGVSHKVKQPVKSLKDQELDKEIDKFIENIDFKEILPSEEELESQVLTDTEFSEQHNNQKVTPVPLKHKRNPLQNQKTKPTAKNDYSSPLQGQKTKPRPKKYNSNLQQEENTNPAPKKYYTVSLKDEKTESTNDYMYPQQEQETEPAPINDYKFPLQDQKAKPPPKNYHLNSKHSQKTKLALEKYNTVPLQDEETKSALKNGYIIPLQDRTTIRPINKYFTVPLQDEETKSAQKKYNTFPLRDPSPKNDDMFPLRDPSPKNDDMFPLQNQKIQPAPTNYNLQQQQEKNTNPATKKYYTVSLQDENTVPAPTNDYIYPQQKQETEPAPTNNYKFLLQDQKTKTTPKKKKLNPKRPQQDHKKKAQPKNDYTFLPQDEEKETAPTNGYIYAQQKQEANSAQTTEHKFPLQDQKKKQPPKNYYLNPQQDQKKKQPPKNYYLNPQQDQKKKAPPKNDFPLQDGAKPPPTKDYMYAQQVQETELAPTNDHKFPLQDQKTNQEQKKYFLNPLQDQKKKSPPQNDFTFPLQDEAEPASTKDYMHAQQVQGTELAPTNDHKFPLQDQKTKPPPKKYYTIPQQYKGIKPPQKNEDEYLRFIPQAQHAKPAPTHNVLLPFQDQEVKPAKINSDVSPLQRQEPEPAKRDDILSLLFLTDNERKRDDSSPEGLSIEKKRLKDLTMSLVFDVITEELRKNRE